MSSPSMYSSRVAQFWWQSLLLFETGKGYTEKEVSKLSDRSDPIVGAANPLTPQTPDFRERVQESYGKQTALALLGAHLAKVEPGEVEIHLPFRADLTQQHGFLHAGIVTTVVDSACGYAAFSLMPADASVLSVEFKMNLLAPAKGEWFLARGKVVKPGRTITVCAGEVFAMGDHEPKLVATMSATMITLQDRPGISPG